MTLQKVSKREKQEDGCLAKPARRNGSKGE